MLFKKISVLFMICCLVFAKANAQFNLDGATLIIQPNASVTAKGDVIVNTDLQGTGKFILNGTAVQNVNMNGHDVPNIEVNNSANINLTGNVKVSGNVSFTAGSILLGNFNLQLGNTGTVSNASNAGFFVTNGGGTLVKSALGTTAFTYPVGNTINTYNPVSITNTGTADDIAVKCFTNVYSGGLTGSTLTSKYVDASWNVNEAVAGGSNFSITPSWYVADELPGFDRTKIKLVAYNTGTGIWDTANVATGAASGANPYSFTRTGITAPGTFAVGTFTVASSPSVTSASTAS
ncbi:MAG: hypothetical protein HY305_04220, partial [Sphingobacteriales bacterium]|nr:hypothetical protein [Sphingobacteriales bacterium]